MCILPYPFALAHFADVRFGQVVAEFVNLRPFVGGEVGVGKFLQLFHREFFAGAGNDAGFDFLA